MIGEGIFLDRGSSVEKKEEPLEKAASYLYGYLKANKAVEEWNKMLGYVEQDNYDSRGQSRQAKAAHKAEREALLQEIQDKKNPPEVERQIKAMMSDFASVVEKNKNNLDEFGDNAVDYMRLLVELLKKHHQDLDEFAVSMIWKNLADLFIEKGMPELGRAISHVANRWFEEAA